MKSSNNLTKVQLFTVLLIALLIVLSEQLEFKAYLRPRSNNDQVDEWQWPRWTYHRPSKAPLRDCPCCTWCSWPGSPSSRWTSGAGSSPPRCRCPSSACSRGSVTRGTARQSRMVASCCTWSRQPTPGTQPRTYWPLAHTALVEAGAGGRADAAGPDADAGAAPDLDSGGGQQARHRQAQEDPGEIQYIKHCTDSRWRLSFT